jgi:hypothetical protein
MDPLRVKKNLDRSMSIRTLLECRIAIRVGQSPLLIGTPTRR